MIIRSVGLKNFRSHEDYLLECSKMTSLIVGENGCGKTSVLEAIYIALRGKSFRAVDRDIVRRGEEFYRVEVLYADGDKVVVVYDGVRKQFLVEDRKFSRLPKKNRYPVILFEPGDLNLVGASQARRRDYFDRMFADLAEVYHNSLLKYTKALRQRNEALKRGAVSAGDLFSWNVMLAKYGCSLGRMRREFVARVNERLTEVYRVIAENEDEVFLRYLGEEVDESGYLKRLEEGFSRDLAVGYTGFGVHREGFLFEFNGVAADGSASRGEIRSMIIALKFIEAEMVFSEFGRKPLVLLDDVFSELDETRQKCLVKNFQDHQVILSSVEGV